MSRCAALGRVLSRMFGVRPLGLRWTKLAGPYFGNAVGALVHNGPQAYVAVEATDADATLVRVMQAQLSP